MAVAAPPLAPTAPPDTAWDAFAGAHPLGHPLQAAAWGQLKGGFGWSPRLLALAAGGQLAAGALLLTRRRAGLAACYTPRGPLLSGEPAIDAALLDQLLRAARAARAVFLRVEPPALEGAPGSGELHSALILRGFQPAEPIQPRSSIHLDLAPEPEQLLASMSKGHRADIRRAAREGVAVRAAAPSELAAFYAILSSTAARNQFGIHTEGYYAAALRHFGDAAQIWLAEREGQAEAAALTIAFGQAALYLYSGSTEAGLRSGAQHAIQWATIQWARARGCRIYDFWGVPDAYGQAALEPDPAARAQLEEQARGDALAGVYRFKKGFGGQVVRYLPAYDYILIPPLYALWRRLAG